MRRGWIVIVGGLVLVAAGVEGYRRLHSRPIAAAVESTEQPKLAPIDLIADADLQAVAEQLGETKSGISVTAWTQAHPEDKREDTDLNGCAAFRWTRQLADGRTLRRLATFYPPDPPKPLELPTNEDPASLIRGCTLAWIQVELDVEGREKLLRSIPKIQANFTKRMGNPNPQLAAFGYPLESPWHDRDAAVVIQKNTDVNPLFASNAVSQTLRVQWQSKASLVMYAYLPRVVEDKTKTPAGELYEVVSPETSPEVFELAMRAAAVEQTDLVKTMNALYQESYQHPQLSGNDPSYQEKRTTAGLERGKRVVDALDQWLTVTRQLPPQRKAGGLLAAYFLLKGATDHLEDPEMEAMRDWLLEKKVIASEKELGPWGATAKWAIDARDLDPEGPIGDAVALMEITNPQQMNELMPGYRLVAEAQGQKDVTDLVIETGEKFLARPRDPETTERVEYFIASGYSDRIQLARFDAEDKPSDWEIQRAAAAKPEAIKYFSMAMAGGSLRAVTAWRKGWRVLAGLPVEIRFYDLGD
jgi:hypothetical protein